MRRGERDSQVQECGVFNIKMKQKETKTTRGEKTGRQAELTHTRRDI